MSTTQDRTASLAVLLALQVVTVDRRVICAPIEVRLELGLVCLPVRLLGASVFGSDLGIALVFGVLL